MPNWFLLPEKWRCFKAGSSNLDLLVFPTGYRVSIRKTSQIISGWWLTNPSEK
jgi:hypothetical protein